MNSHIRKILVVAGLSFIASGAGHAASSNTTFQVTALVSSSCSMSAGTLDFGTYDPLSLTDKTGTSTISVTCNLLAPYTLKLNTGTATPASFTGRKMNDGGSNLLAYQLFTSVAHLNVFGDGTSTTSTVTGTGLGPLVPVANVVYGNIVAGQNVPNGSYADTITVTLDF